MSATVLGCGHVSHLHLFETDVMILAPQVHLHFLTGEEEYKELGYGKVEICCHGCGASTLIYYVDEGHPERHLRLRNDFAKHHSMCRNRNYQSECPNWRSSFNTVDIRPKQGRFGGHPLRPEIQTAVPPTSMRRFRKSRHG